MNDKGNPCRKKSCLVLRLGGEARNQLKGRRGESKEIESSCPFSPHIKGSLAREKIQKISGRRREDRLSSGN